MNNLINKIKEFSKSISKPVAILFTALLGVVIVVFAYNQIADYLQKKKDQKYELVTEWNTDLTVIGLNARAKTKVVNGYLYVQLALDGYPAYLSHPALERKNRDAEFILKFIDSEKFELYERRIKVSQFTTSIGNDGKPEGLSHQFSSYISTDTYAKFGKLDIGWTIDTTIPDASQQNSARSGKPGLAESTDHCAPGVSRSERLKRLALHGPIRETSKDSYSAGSRSLTFFYDGSVLYCN